jgi:hypothetical protein
LVTDWLEPNLSFKEVIMTIIELELQIRDRQQRILAEVEHDRLVHLAVPARNLRVRLANALHALGARLDPPIAQARVTHCQDC